jgi:hypothetical protein
MDFTDEKINNLIQQTLNRRAYQREYYKKKYRENPEFRQKMIDRSQNYYNNHKQEIKEKQYSQGDYKNAKRRYDYHVKNNIVEKFIIKYPNDYQKWFKQDDT